MKKLSHFVLNVPFKSGLYSAKYGTAREALKDYQEIRNNPKEEHCKSWVDVYFEGLSPISFYWNGETFYRSAVMTVDHFRVVAGITEKGDGYTLAF
jgi:hypothetical protein